VHIASATNNSTSAQPPVVSGICATVIHRLLQLACPSASTAISALLTCSDLSLAERLLQNSIKDLSSSVPPQAPGLNDWLLLALFSLLRHDTATAAAYLRQADWKFREISPGDGATDRLALVLQLSRCLEAVMSGRRQDAEELLDTCESQPNIDRSPDRMWLVLQLRTATALSRSHYRTAWRNWQAAMLLHRTVMVPAASQPESGSNEAWLRTMALQEAAAEMN
jgi:hypothetical protein